MFNALGRILNGVYFGPHERKVKKYLDGVTTDSVLEDLRKALASKSREPYGLSIVFEAYCIEDPARQRYWNANSLKRHIETAHPEFAISETIINLLWRVFHFYAYHPFPRSATDGRVDSTAFQRAMTLLAIQGTDILGTQDGGDYLWREDDAFFRRADFARIFRSIGLSKPITELSTELDHSQNCSLNDVMDVLAMTQPHTVSLAPSPEQLESAARKLLGHDLTHTRYEVARQDVSTLLSLLLRLRLHEAKWASGFHISEIDPAYPRDPELADVLVDALDVGKVPEAGQTLRVMDLLPNYQLRFHQLWAILFQPPMSADNQVPSHAPTQTSSHILEAISLFIPQPRVSTRSGTTKQDMRIAFERLSEPSQRSDDVTMTQLINSLAHEPHPHLLLITGEKTTTTPLTVIGAYLPGPLRLKTDGEDERHVSQTGTLHLLFQLQPQLHLLRWTGPQIPLRDILQMHEDAPSLEAIAASDATYSKSYAIGAPEKTDTRLRIDSEQNLATLKSGLSSASSGTVTGYTDTRKDCNATNNALNRQCEVTVKIDSFEVFRVSGGVDTDRDNDSLMEPLDRARYTKEAMRPRVEAEELKKRIQGFGSNAAGQI